MKWTLKVGARDAQRMSETGELPEVVFETMGQAGAFNTIRNSYILFQTFSYLLSGHLVEALQEAHATTKEAEKSILQLSQLKGVDQRGRDACKNLKACGIEQLGIIVTIVHILIIISRVAIMQALNEQLLDEDRKVRKCRTLGQDPKGEYLTVQALDTLE